MTATVLFCTDTFWDAWGESVVAIDPTVEVIRLVGDHHVTDHDLARITAAFFSPDCWPSRAKSFIAACLRAPNLTWLQAMSAGTDDPVFTRFLERGVTVTNAAGASAPSIAQHVMWMLLSLARDGRRLAQAQADRVWDPRPSTDLAGLRLGIIGFGSIGAETARLASAFGADIVGLRRHPTGDEACAVWTSDRLGELLSWADAVIVTAPLTDETRGMLDGAALASMRRGAWVINVGRGEIIDEPALITALTSGHLGGAALDVFSTEPLPPHSSLWTLPNVIITPHCSASTERTRRHVVELFLDNFRRQTTGEALRNRVGVADPAVPVGGARVTQKLRMDKVGEGPSVSESPSSVGVADPAVPVGGARVTQAETPTQAIGGPDCACTRRSHPGNSSADSGAEIP